MSTYNKTPLNKLFDLSGKVALVTGGAMGIGFAIVERLAEAGAAVLISDIDGKAGEAAAAQMTGKGYKAAFIKTDAGKVSEIVHAVAEAKVRFGGLNILVNNAGIFPMSPVMNTTEELWDKVMAINLKGPFFFAQHAAKLMMENGQPGKIINIASIDAIHPTGNLVHYDASKGGVLMMTKSLALELAPHNITVNAIAPGGITTPGVAKISEGMLKASGLSPEAFAEMMKGFGARIPMGRQGDPDDIAAPVLFLVSDASRYITGETIVVDGGYLLS
ncbi:MAG: SDR family oxidoreductase [Turneriella sp.]